MRFAAGLILATLAGPAGAGQAADLARFEEAWASSRGDGVAVVVIALDPEVGEQVRGVVVGDAPGATVTVVTAASAEAVGEVAATSGADVVALALGEVSFGDRLLAAPDLVAGIAAAGAGGAVVVAASGTAAESLGPAPPTADVVVVGAVTAAGQPRPFANRSLPRALDAEGAVGDGQVDDTSVAAGHVAAAAALLVAQGRPPAEVDDILVASAANPFGDARLGAGYLDAAAAVATPISAVLVEEAPVTSAPAPAPVAETEAAPAPDPVGAAPGGATPRLAALVAAALLLGDLALGRVAWRRRSVLGTA